MQVRSCPRCGQSIYWAMTTNGSGVPLNIRPVKTAITVTAHFASEPVMRLVDGYQIHLDTCTGPAPEAKPPSSRGAKTKQATS